MICCGMCIGMSCNSCSSKDRQKPSIHSLLSTYLIREKKLNIIVGLYQIKCTSCVCFFRQMQRVGRKTNNVESSVNVESVRHEMAKYCTCLIRSHGCIKRERKKKTTKITFFFSFLPHISIDDRRRLSRDPLHMYTTDILKLSMIRLFTLNELFINIPISDEKEISITHQFVDEKISIEVDRSIYLRN